MLATKNDPENVKEAVDALEIVDETDSELEEILPHLPIGNTGNTSANVKDDTKDLKIVEDVDGATKTRRKILHKPIGNSENTSANVKDDMKDLIGESSLPRL